MTKKLQTQNVSKEMLRKTISCKKSRLQIFFDEIDPQLAGGNLTRVEYSKQNRISLKRTFFFPLSLSSDKKEEILKFSLLTES